MSIAINPQNDQEIFLGTNVHGVYKTTDEQVGETLGALRRLIPRNVTTHTQSILQLTQKIRISLL